jgi:RNA polymerase sigma factor (sigma-70 family)
MFCIECEKKEKCEAICPLLEAHLSTIERYQREKICNEEKLSLINGQESIIWKNLVPDSPWVWDDISECLNCLPDILRSPFLLYYYEGMKTKDVAKTLGIHRTTVNKRLKRAVQSIKNEFELKGITTNN